MSIDFPKTRDLRYESFSFSMIFTRLWFYFWLSICSQIVQAVYLNFQVIFMKSELLMSNFIELLPENFECRIYTF